MTTKKEGTKEVSYFYSVNEKIQSGKLNCTKTHQLLNDFFFLLLNINPTIVM